MPSSTRRHLLAGAALIAVSRTAFGATIAKVLPWAPNAVDPPRIVQGKGWHFFTADEAAAMEAIVDRLIPADALGAGGKQAGCAVFIDRQLAGPFGANDGLYMQGPFPPDPLPTQGLQSPLSPRDQYRKGLAALAAYCRAQYSGKTFGGLSAAEQDALLHGLEQGKIALAGTDGKAFFNTLLTNTVEGYFADPIYGGNQDMAGWKLIGFPGTRYDYRDVIAHPDKPYTLPPVGLRGREGKPA